MQEPADDHAKEQLDGQRCRCDNESVHVNFIGRAVDILEGFITGFALRSWVLA